MPETPEDLYARVLAAADADRRLPLPPVASWDIFPFDGDLAVRPLEPPADAEPPREGEGGVGCGRCADPERDVIWENERWVVTSTPAPTGLPLVLFLVPREHLDYDDLDDEMASECGRISVWLSRILDRLDGIGRTHVYKVGDGAEHLHVWFFARPARLLQVRGSAVPEWDDILPPGPEDVWRQDLARVARQLASHEGRALV
jgi:diadenosine tetraphosphate (Ap4A) HIT family hydrolase